MKNNRLRCLLAAAALFAVGCTQQAAPTSAEATGGGPTAGKGAAAVAVEKIAFSPEDMTVLAGTEVTWRNGDEGVRHTATSGEPGERAVAGVAEGSEAKPDGLFDGDMPNAGAEFSFTFAEAGTYPYFCEIHPSMTGVIVVE